MKTIIHIAEYAKEKAKKMSTKENVPVFVYWDPEDMGTLIFRKSLYDHPDAELKYVVFPDGLVFVYVD